MPLYTLRNKTTGETVQTTDPGPCARHRPVEGHRPLQGADARALPARAPYFHNGFAKDMNEVVKFYDDRFNIGFTAQEKEDLVAFLKAL